MDLTSTPIEELRSEIKRRERIAQLQAAASLRERQMLACKNVDLLLRFVPFHGRSSCTDKSPTNARDCPRCTLLLLKKNDFDGQTGFEVEIVVKPFQPRDVLPVDRWYTDGELLAEFSSDPNDPHRVDPAAYGGWPDGKRVDHYNRYFAKALRQLYATGNPAFPYALVHENAKPADTTDKDDLV